jgi:RNA polymerase sigma-70 factor (ECF subfamily)
VQTEVSAEAPVAPDDGLYAVTASRYHDRRSALSEPSRRMAIPPRPISDVQHPAPLSPEATADLLELIKQGDQPALERLLHRCLPALRRWAHGRLPAFARGMHETSDLVQDVVFVAMSRLDVFEARHQGALQAYLRQAVMNRIRDLIRQHRRRPERAELPEQLPDTAESPLEQAIGAENIERYEKAIQRLDADDREAIIGRIELQYSYDELAIALNRPSPAAARMAVTRAMKRLAREMQHE